jgi:WD40 repeat protein
MKYLWNKDKPERAIVSDILRKIGLIKSNLRFLKTSYKIKYLEEDLGRKLDDFTGKGLQSILGAGNRQNFDDNFWPLMCFYRETWYKMGKKCHRKTLHNLHVCLDENGKPNFVGQIGTGSVVENKRNYLFTSGDRSVKIWDIANMGDWKSSQPLVDTGPLHRQRIQQLLIDSSGEYLFTLSKGTRIKVYSIKELLDPETDGPEPTFKVTLPLNRTSRDQKLLPFSLDHIYCKGKKASVVEPETATPEVQTTFENPKLKNPTASNQHEINYKPSVDEVASPMAYCEKLRWLFIITGDLCLWVLDFTNPRWVKTKMHWDVPICRAPPSSVMGLYKSEYLFIPDNFDVIIHKCNPIDHMDPQKPHWTIKNAHYSRINALVINESCKILCTGCNNGFVAIWSLQNMNS